MLLIAIEPFFALRKSFCTTMATACQLLVPFLYLYPGSFYQATRWLHKGTVLPIWRSATLAPWLTRLITAAWVASILLPVTVDDDG